jgi:WD repeat-containing protein 35
MLDEILKDPEDIKNINDMITDYEAKTLKDTRDFLTTVSLKEAVEFVEKNPHPRLWKLICETALEKLNFNVAERAFVKTDDYHGVQLIQKLQTYDERNKQKAEIHAWFGRFDDAEEIYRTIDRKDLALDMRQKLGDWPRVVQIIEQGAGNDESLRRAYKNLGDYSAERGKWQKAVKYYTTAQDNESLVEAFFKLEDFDNLEKLIRILPENSPILDTLGERFQSMGLCEAACASYLKMGDVKKAIDCCVLLNQWN